MSGSFGAEDLPVSGEPWVLFDGPDYAVVYKPPGMFSAPQKRDAGGKTLLGWYADRFPAVLEIRGRQAWEGGILHRLDYETSGLVLFAKNQTAMETLSARQAAGCFVKDYQALTAKERSPTRLPGFPPPPEAADSPESRSIESAFRPYGPGRKVVRPVAWAAAAVPAPDRGKPYRTEITGVELLPPGTLGSAGGSPGNFTGDGAEGYRRFYVRISRGFRHQIRCHLSWIGYPILNDGLYGEGKTGGGAAGKAEGSFLALTAVGLSFPDPRTGEKRDFFLS